MMLIDISCTYFYDWDCRLIVICTRVDCGSTPRVRTTKSVPLSFRVPSQSMAPLRPYESTIHFTGTPQDPAIVADDNSSSIRIIW